MQFLAYFEEKNADVINFLLTLYFFPYGFEKLLKTQNPTKFYGYSLIQTDFRIGRPIISSSFGRVEIDAGQAPLR